MSYTPGKLGKHPAVRLYGISNLDVYGNGKLPSPKPAVPVPDVADWGMDGNDQYGNCVMAGCAHELLAWNAEVAEHDAVPTSDEVVSQYFDLTGGEDRGLNVADTLVTWQRKGLFGGGRIAAFAPVNHSSLLDLHAAVDFYGVCKIGVQLPQSAQEQFANGDTWTVVPGSPIQGGHDMEIVGYDAHAAQVVTWGQVVNISYPWLAAYVDEAFAIIAHQFVEAKRGPDLNLAALIEDIGRL